MRRVSRPAAAILVLALAGCAPAGATDRTVAVHGILERTAALSGLEGWILTTDAGPILSVELPADAGDASNRTCVRIVVDDDFPESDDEAEVAAALGDVVDRTGEPLVVTAFC